MPPYRFIPVRLGSYTQNVLDTKAKPRRVHSMEEQKRKQRELDKIEKLNKWVLRWVDNNPNLDKTAKKQFYDALGEHRYGDAHAVLDGAFFSNGCVMFWERNKFDKWIANFDRKKKLISS